MTDPYRNVGVSCFGKKYIFIYKYTVPYTVLLIKRTSHYDCNNRTKPTNYY